MLTDANMQPQPMGQGGCPISCNSFATMLALHRGFQFKKVHMTIQSFSWQLTCDWLARSSCSCMEVLLLDRSYAGVLMPRGSLITWSWHYDAIQLYTYSNCPTVDATTTQILVCSNTTIWSGCKLCTLCAWH